MTKDFVSGLIMAAWIMAATTGIAAPQEPAVTDRAPRMLEAEALKGDWRLETAAKECQVELGLDAKTFPGPNAPGWEMRDGGCLSGLNLGGVEAWRPSSDGIALLRNDGSLVVFLSRRGQGFEGSGPDGERLRLVRV